MSASDLITLDELKRYAPARGSAKDVELAEAIAFASREIEEHLDRRIVFRAPTESANSIRTTTNWTDGAPAVSAQPAAARTLVVNWSGTPKAGTLTVTGTVAGVAGVTEVFDVVNGLAQYGVKFFTAISALAIANATSVDSASATLTIGTSLGYIEYHNACGPRFRPYEYPIRSAGEANEDVALTHGTSTALVQGTDYAVHERKYFTRLYSGLPLGWLPGWRVVKVRYSAGYFTVANVPADIKAVCKELAAWHFRYSENKEQGAQSINDGTGTRTFFGPPMLTEGMKGRLAKHIREDCFDRTGERDFDLEAA